MKTKVYTEDGSQTIYSEKFNEHYHSTYGALSESEHVFISAGLNHSQLKHIKIFEVGFGTGLNTILTYKISGTENLTVEYTSIELYPLHLEIIDELDYKSFLTSNEFKKFKLMHSAEWNKTIEIDKNFTLHKIKADLLDFKFLERYDLIYFDAFAPDKQPNMWSAHIFESLYNACNTNAILTTYSSKGLVKRNLRNAGFKVSRLSGPPGKRHILRAEKL